MSRQIGSVVAVVAAWALVSCGSSPAATGTNAPDSAVTTTIAATATCTTAGPASPMSTTTVASSTTTTANPLDTAQAAQDAAEVANTGMFTFDVVCQHFGDCACDAALAEPLTTTISFSPEGVTFTNDDGSIIYPRVDDGTFQLLVDDAEQKVATIRFTATGFEFDMRIAGAPCSEQTYTRR